MEPCRATVLLVVVSVLGVAHATLDAALQYSVSPFSGGKVPPSLMAYPIVQPAIFKENAYVGFGTYERKNTSHRDEFVQMVSPENPHISYAKSALHFDTIQQELLPTGNSDDEIIISFMKQGTSYWQVVKGSTVIGPMERFGSTAPIAVSTNKHVAYVPLGNQATAATPHTFDGIEAVSLQSGSPATMWRAKLPLEAPSGGEQTLIQANIFYEESLFVMHGNRFLRLNATNGHVTMNISNPCNIDPTNGRFLNLVQVEYGSETNGGHLSAFIVYGNTSSAAGSFEMGRVSHRSGEAEWSYHMHRSFQVHDVVGGAAEYLAVTGRHDDVSDYREGWATFVMGIGSGKAVMNLTRTFQDRFNYPLIVYGSVNFASHCGAVLYWSNQSNLEARCVADNRQLWTSDVKCHGRPVFIAEEEGNTRSRYLACITDGSRVNLMDAATGKLLWFYSCTALTGLQYVHGGLWTVDRTARLLGFSLQGKRISSPPSPHQPHQTPGYAVALIVIFAVGGLGAGGFIAFRFLSRPKRRAAYDEEQQLGSGSYGSVTA